MWECRRHGQKTREDVLKQPKRISTTSVAQQVRTAFLNGIKAERARAMFEQYGWVYCQRCTKAADGMNLDDALKWAMKSLDSAHTVKRARGTRYLGPTRMGIDTPTNVSLLCRKCHEETEK